MKVENEKKRSKVEPMFDFSIRKFLQKISAKCVMSLGADNEVFRYFQLNYLTALIFCILFHQGKSIVFYFLLFNCSSIRLVTS